MADTTDNQEPDILDQLLGDDPAPGTNSPADAPSNDEQDNNDDRVEPTGPAEGVEIVDDMGNYETKGPF